MLVERTPLPGTATVVVFGSHRRVLIDSSLSRDQAALAITGVLPHIHTDVVDHWLDTAFARRKLPFSARQVNAGIGLALCLVVTFTSIVTHQPTSRRRPVSLSAMVLTLPEPLPV